MAYLWTRPAKSAACRAVTCCVAWDPSGLRSCVRRLNPVGSTRRVCQGTATTGQLAPARPAIPELAGQRLERRRRGVTGTYASVNRNGSPCFRNDRAAHSCAAGPGPQQSSPGSHVTSPGPGCPTPKPASHATASRWAVCPRSRPPPALMAGGGSVLPVDDGRASLPRELTRQASTGVGRTRITDRQGEPPGERPTHLRHSLCRGRRLMDSAAGQRVTRCDRHNHSGTMCAGILLRTRTEWPSARVTARTAGTPARS